MYINDGMFVWDGDKAIPLDYSIDFNGSIPNEFIVSKDDFSPSYWRGVIKHNNFYYPSEEIRNFISASIKNINSKWTGYFYFDDEIYDVIFISDFYMKKNDVIKIINDMSKPHELISYSEDENQEMGGNLVIVREY
uniref:Uncharacterized protein n=1 Tax=viral metagenome TaxID=1070528 RepID=A0A6C0AEI5_9ZZZZ